MLLAAMSTSVGSLRFSAASINAFWLWMINSAGLAVRGLTQSLRNGNTEACTSRLVSRNITLIYAD